MTRTSRPDLLNTRTREEEIGIIQQPTHTGGGRSNRRNRFRFGNTTIAEARRNTANNNDRNEQTKQDGPNTCSSELVAGIGVPLGEPPAAWASVLVTGGGASPGTDLVAREPSELSRCSPNSSEVERAKQNEEEEL